MLSVLKNGSEGSRPVRFAVINWGPTEQENHLYFICRPLLFLIQYVQIEITSKYEKCFLSLIKQ